MTSRTKVLGGLFIVALLATFIGGYWPERQKRVVAETEARALRERAGGLEDRVRAAGVHGGLLDLIDAIEAMNYGEAQSLSSVLFDRIRDEATRTQDPGLRVAFQTLLTSRDAVTGALAKGDGAVIAPLKESERALRRVIQGGLTKGSP